MNRMKWRVMKTFGLLPSSPMVKQMNDVQWMYCYLNIAKDMEEEDNLFRMRAKYQGIFINPEAVKKVSEEEEKQKYIYGKCPASKFGTGFMYRQFSRCYFEDRIINRYIL